MGDSGLPGQPGQAKGMLIPTEEWSLLVLGARMGGSGHVQQFQMGLLALLTSQ